MQHLQVVIHRNNGVKYNFLPACEADVEIGKEKVIIYFTTATGRKEIQYEESLSSIKLIEVRKG